MSYRERVVLNNFCIFTVRAKKKMATIVFDDTFEVSALDNEKFDSVTRIKAKVGGHKIIPIRLY